MHDTMKLDLLLAGTAKLDWESVDLTKIDSEVLRGALERIKSRAAPSQHANYYTKHGSHNRYSKGW
jgi:hypothetical protein